MRTTLHPRCAGRGAGRTEPMRLPNGVRADLGTKLEDYILSAGHREGRHKARMFQSVLGIGTDDADIVRRALLNAAAEGKCKTWTSPKPYRLALRPGVRLSTILATGTVLSVWMVRHGEDSPRLATCYIV